MRFLILLLVLTFQTQVWATCHRAAPLPGAVVVAVQQILPSRTWISYSDEDEYSVTKDEYGNWELRWTAVRKGEDTTQELIVFASGCDEIAHLSATHSKNIYRNEGDYMATENESAFTGIVDDHKSRLETEHEQWEKFKDEQKGIRDSTTRGEGTYSSLTSSAGDIEESNSYGKSERYVDYTNDTNITERYNGCASSDTRSSVNKSGSLFYVFNGYEEETGSWQEHGALGFGMCDYYSDGTKACSNLTDLQIAKTYATSCSP